MLITCAQDLIDYVPQKIAAIHPDNAATMRASTSDTHRPVSSALGSEFVSGVGKSRPELGVLGQVEQGRQPSSGIFRPRGIVLLHPRCAPVAEGHRRGRRPLAARRQGGGGRLGRRRPVGCFRSAYPSGCSAGLSAPEPWAFSIRGTSLPFASLTSLSSGCRSASTGPHTAPPTTYSSRDTAPLPRYGTVGAGSAVGRP
jgi:hypothetical protein